MKTKLVPSIHLMLKPSYNILGCFVLVSMLSLISVMLAKLPLLLKCVIVFSVIIATIYTILQDVLLRLPWSWQCLEVTSQGQVRVHNQRGDIFEVELKASSISHPWLTILRFNRLAYRYGLRNSFMVIASNVQDQQQYRKLRVWLNWGKANTVLDQPLDELIA